jgi:HD-GYP domain-containing protein (c-di-GMP phosphodiesterase class II)
MQTNSIDSSLRNAEQRTATWFIILFYLISVSYDLFYYFIRPKYITDGAIGLPSTFSYWIYVIMFLLIPIVFYMNRNKKEYLTKYIYSITYLVLTLINDFFYYYGNDKSFDSANIAEMFIILFAPIFVNSRFFWIVALGTMLKYIILGLALSDTSAIMNGIMIIFIVALISFILLNRFKGYVAAVKSSYDLQLEGIVKGVIATLELKDPYTRGHSERVASYAQVLAIETGMFSKEELKAFYYACLLHDIGKIHIPDQILMKPTQLTKEEYEIIQTHPAVGAEAVKDVEGLTNHINVIRSHHERWDGKGYPDQLKDSEIPILARIVSLADAFDAMTSSRSYRSAMPVDEAFKRIIDGKGSQFDPKLVEVFQTVFPKWTKIHNKFQ